MDNLNLNKHISGQFNAELEYIRTQVLTMGGAGGNSSCLMPSPRCTIRTAIWQNA
ncbi:Phosphate transport system protein phoU [Raoultella planticola]|uniref:Phosphate transport system protein phoU n=1 Tax=Raoultella planticola TaxID=575 RepID=A0A485BCH6_RAOPL|nr:Phosphate transport system protein phoU [Raoultella planticola]